MFFQSVSKCNKHKKQQNVSSLMHLTNLHPNKPQRQTEGGTSNPSGVRASLRFFLVMAIYRVPVIFLLALITQDKIHYLGLPAATG